MATKSNEKEQKAQFKEMAIAFTQNNLTFMLKMMGEKRNVSPSVPPVAMLAGGIDAAMSAMASVHMALDGSVNYDELRTEFNEMCKACVEDSILHMQKTGIFTTKNDK